MGTDITASQSVDRCIMLYSTLHTNLQRKHSGWARKSLLQVYHEATWCYMVVTHLKWAIWEIYSSRIREAWNVRNQPKDMIYAVTPAHQLILIWYIYLEYFHSDTGPSHLNANSALIDLDWCIQNYLASLKKKRPFKKGIKLSTKLKLLKRIFHY